MTQAHRFIVVLLLTVGSASPLSAQQAVDIQVQPTFSFEPKENPSRSWEAKLGSESYTRPATTKGKVFIGTNNGAGYRKGIDAKQDKGVLLCLDDSNGEFLWQLTRDKLKSRDLNDFRFLGIVSQPCVEGNRLWLVTNRGEVMCLDTEGFLDGENDGAYQTEKLNTKQDADIIWSLDMVEELGVYSYLKFVGDPVIFEDLVFINTSNGVAENRPLLGRRITEGIPNHRAPTFLAINKNTGEIVWKNNQPLDNILQSSWGSPAIGIVKGVPQVYFPGGDGWMYAFHARTGRLIWKFDMNPKESVWEAHGTGTRSSAVARPVFYDDSVIIAVGQSPEDGDGEGHLWRIDATGTGDRSAELGEIEKKGRPNPNSGVIWHYGAKLAILKERDPTKEDSGIKPPDPEKVNFGRTMASPAISNDGLLFISDLTGYVHCLNVETGMRHWEFDLLSRLWGSPILYRNNLLIGDEDGIISVFKPINIMNDPQQFNTNNFEPVYTTVHAAGDSVYVTSRNHLTKFKFPSE